MITAVFVIQETDKGIILEQISLSDRSKASGGERAVATILDIASRAVMEFVAKQAQDGTMIEGKDIEQYISGHLKKHHALNFRDELRKAGINLPP